MAVVVGCPRCRTYDQRPLERAASSPCPTCEQPRRVMLLSVENEERIHRGIGLDEWFAAPHVPETRGECEDSARPCPYVRCRFHLGRPGEMGCALDVALDGDLPEHGPTAGIDPANSLARIAKLLAVTEGRAKQLEASAYEAYRDGRARLELARELALLSQALKAAA